MAKAHREIASIVNTFTQNTLGIEYHGSHVDLFDPYTDEIKYQVPVEFLQRMVESEDSSYVVLCYRDQLPWE